MPALIPLAAAIAGAAAAAAIPGFVGALVGALVTFAVSFVGNALFAPKKPSSSAAQTLADRKRTLRESAAPRRVIVGRVKIGGALIFVNGRDADGVKDKYLLLAIALAGHSISGVEQIYLDDVPLSDPKFAGLVKWEILRGMADQVPPAWVVTESGGKWTDQHRCAGCAILFIRLTKNDTAFPSGLPEITAIVAGNDAIPDPRTGTQGYSANPARVLGWYLSSPLGLNEPADAIDANAWIAAANLCDEDVPLAAGGTEKRWRCHGSFTLDEQPQDILQKLLSSCAGEAIYAGGQWFIEPAAWRPSNRVITADEIRGAVTRAANRPFRDLANGVRATYVRPAASWEETDAPPLLDAAAVAEDGGEPSYADLELPFTLSGTMAQRIMQVRLRRLRAQRSYKIPTMLHHLALRPGSVVALDMPRRARETMRLDGWSLDEDGGGITLTGQQDGPDIYAWNPATDERPLLDAGEVDAPSGADILTPTLTLTPPGAPVPSSIDASWTAVTGAAGYQLEWRGPAGGAFTVTSQAGTSATISTGGRAEMRVRADKGDGEWSTYGAALFPAALTRFVAAGAPGGATVEFSGAASVQVFANSIDDLAGSTLAGTLSSSPALVSLSAGTWYLWARPIGDGGAVGAEVGSIIVIAEDASSGGSIGTGAGGESGPADGGTDTDSPGDSPGGDSSGGET